MSKEDIASAIKEAILETDEANKKRQNRNLYAQVGSVIALLVTCLTFAANRSDKITDKMDTIIVMGATIKTENVEIKAEQDRERQNRKDLEARINYITENSKKK